MHWSGAGVRSICRLNPTVHCQCICFVRLKPRRPGQQLFRNDFDEDAVRENRATEQVNASVPGEAAQHGLAGNGWFGGFLSAAAGWNCGGSDPGRRRLDTLGWAPLALGTAVHGVVRQLIGCLVLVAEGMANLEAIELRDAAPRFLPKRTQIG